MKLLKLSNFTFFHNVFYVICFVKSFNSYISVVACRVLEYGMVSKWFIGEWVKIHDCLVKVYMTSHAFNRYIYLLSNNLKKTLRLHSGQLAKNFYQSIWPMISLWRIKRRVNGCTSSSNDLFHFGHYGLKVIIYIMQMGLLCCYGNWSSSNFLLIYLDSLLHDSSFRPEKIDSICRQQVKCCTNHKIKL